MPRSMPRLLALAPALGLAAFAAALGGLESGARAPHGALGRGLILLVALAGARELADPLRLGRRAAWLPWAAVAWVAASWQLSALPRAGRVGVLLLPAL